MLDRFTASLEARNPDRGHFRAYQIDAGIDLLGDWIVDITFGRIGSPGRTIRQTVISEAEAQAFVQRVIRRRRAAKTRIGVAYQILDLHDPDGWLGLPI